MDRTTDLYVESIEMDEKCRQVLSKCKNLKNGNQNATERGILNCRSIILFADLS